MVYIHEQKKWLRDLYKQRFEIETKSSSYINFVIAFVEKFDGERVEDAIITRCVTHKGFFFYESMIRLKQHKSRLLI